MAKSCAAFLVFLCLSMLILSFPEVEAKVCMKLKVEALEGSTCKICDPECIKWENGSHGVCKKYEIRIACTCP
ncbi:unnamed protein product [Microthlaspi erraticum]|uniref:Knottin scorpion toxin-like domain-containing protein n=1 Tax=Microthlaspi erraticum TaxID=1685480 RepID=A0A6D2K9H7_9BRAS|nr:unnamed protein product [Microthlaspi erraticum]